MVAESKHGWGRPGSHANPDSYSCSYPNSNATWRLISTRCVSGQLDCDYQRPRAAAGRWTMKSLWLVSDRPNATYEGLEYRLGWWDEESQSWRLNDTFAEDLLALLKSLGWGNPDVGDVPNLKIETRGSNA